MYLTVNDKNEIEVYVEEDDNCYTCSNMKICPLLASLQNEIVILRYEGLNISECGMYKGIDIYISGLIEDHI